MDIWALHLYHPSVCFVLWLRKKKLVCKFYLPRQTQEEPFFFAFKAILIRHKTSKLNLPILPIILFFFAKYRGHNPFIIFVQIVQSFPFFFRKIHHQCISSFFCSQSRKEPTKCRIIWHQVNLIPYLVLTPFRAFHALWFCFSFFLKTLDFFISLW